MHEAGVKCNSAGIHWQLFVMIHLRSYWQPPFCLRNALREIPAIFQISSFVGTVLLPALTTWKGVPGDTTNKRRTQDGISSATAYSRGAKPSITLDT
jgi:hypothetical protein